MLQWIDIKNQAPPVNVGVLVTDGKSITVCILEYLSYPNSGMKILLMGAHGWGGPEWEFDFQTEEITHWMPLPELPQ